MGNRIIADSVRGLPHIGSFDDMSEERFNLLDFTPLFIYMIDTVPAIALPYLAETFDVLGYKGWKFADTEAKQRALIKNAVTLHRYAGTPFAIKNSILTATGAECRIIEGLGLKYNGIADYNGVYTYNGGSAFLFRVILDYASFASIDSQLIFDLKSLINEWKNARSTLVDVSFSVDGNDQLGSVDTLDITVVHPSNHLLDYEISL